MTGRKSYMSDGKIMIDEGYGWKLYSSWKPGVDIAAGVARQKARYDAKPREYHDYIAALKSTGPIKDRWKIHAAVSLMPGDPDGAWSSLECYGEGYDLDDLVRVCSAYEALLAKGNESA